MSAHTSTPRPWGWQKFGDEWMLVGQHGARPVVLSIRRSGPVKERGFMSLVAGRLVPFDPTHPDARQVAAEEVNEFCDGIELRGRTIGRLERLP